jgi:hypothetical protein
MLAMPIGYVGLFGSFDELQRLPLSYGPVRTTWLYRQLRKRMQPVQIGHFYQHNGCWRLYRYTVPTRQLWPSWLD